jgi:hypothetical protein
MASFGNGKSRFKSTSNWENGGVLKGSVRSLQNAAHRLPEEESEAERRDGKYIFVYTFDAGNDAFKRRSVNGNGQTLCCFLHHSLSFRFSKNWNKTGSIKNGKQ